MKVYSEGKSRFAKLLKKNGVFIALAFGLIAVFAVGYFGMYKDKGNTVEKIEERPVEQVVTNQSDDRTTTTTTAKKAATTTATTTTKNWYVFPLSETVQKPFSAEQPVYSETTKDWRLHLGTDFAGEAGDTVRSVTKGTVKSIADDRLWGNIITIDHGLGVVTRYCGVVASVKVGDKVETGGTIGKLADIPCESAQTAHLHMEMTVDDVPIDPLSAIKQKPKE